MKELHEEIASLLSDEQGGEVLAYALIAGLIVVAAIAVSRRLATSAGPLGFDE